MEARRTRVIAVGEEAPDFRLPAAHGGAVALSDYRGQRHVVLAFLDGMT